MAKRIYFGWAQFTKKDTGKEFKMLSFGEDSDVWHGIEVKTRYVPLSMSIPRCEPGTMLDIEFDDRGNIENICVAKS